MIVQLKSKIKNIDWKFEGIKYGYVFLVLSFFFMPFNRWQFHYLIAAACFFPLLDPKFYKNYSIKGYQKVQKYFYYATLFFVLLHIVGFFVSDNKHIAALLIKVRASIILYLVFIPAYAKAGKNINNVFIAFILGTIAVTLLSYINAIDASLMYNEFGELIFNHRIYPEPQLNDIQMLAYGYSNFSYVNLSAFMHPAHFSLYIEFSIALIYYFIKENIIKIKKVYLISIVAYLSFFLLLLISKAGIASFILLAFFLLLIEFIKYRKKKFVLIGVFIIISIGVFFITSSRLTFFIEDVKESIKTRNIEELVNSNDRFIIWSNSLELGFENFLFGPGAGDAKQLLINKYQENGYPEFAEARYNSHNEFLESFVKFGFVGFTALVFIFILLYIYAIKKRDYLNFSFLIIISTGFLFESILMRSQGVIFYAAITSVLMFWKNNHKKISENK